MKNKTTRHKIIFDHDADAEALALAKLGIGNRRIEMETGLTSNKINYRLSKAQRIEGGEGGYRAAWRHGDSPYFNEVKGHYLAVLQANIRTTITPRLMTVVTPPKKKKAR